MYQYNLIYYNRIDEDSEALMKDQSMTLGVIDYTHPLQKGEVVTLDDSLLQQIYDKFPKSYFNHLWVKQVCHSLPEGIPSVLLSPIEP